MEEKKRGSNTLNRTTQSHKLTLLLKSPTLPTCTTSSHTCVQIHLWTAPPHRILLFVFLPSSSPTSSFVAFRYYFDISQSCHSVQGPASSLQHSSRPSHPRLHWNCMYIPPLLLPFACFVFCYLFFVFCFSFVYFHLAYFIFLM